MELCFFAFAATTRKQIKIPKTNVWTQKNNRLSLISSSRNLSNILFEPVSRQETVVDWFVFSLIYIKFASKKLKINNTLQLKKKSASVGDQEFVFERCIWSVLFLLSDSNN